MAKQKEQKEEKVTKDSAASAPAKESSGPKRKSKPKLSVSRGKRKESVARAIIRSGKGVVRINGMALDALDHEFLTDIIKEPLNIAGDLSLKVDIDVNVHGGGRVGQAEAARQAIARSLVSFSKDDALKQAFVDHDRFLMVEDARRVEPKKYRGPKARARFQKSYR